MTRNSDGDQLHLFALKDFETPFGGCLDRANRWVLWAELIPWHDLAASYHATLKSGGRPAKPARLVLGALIIKHRLRLSDVETVEQLREYPYLQYFCGFQHYQKTATFAPTLFVKLRERLSPNRFAAFEQAIIDQSEGVVRPSKFEPAEWPGDDGGDGLDNRYVLDGSNAPSSDAAPRGHLVVDASVAEQHLRYPTDIGLMNDARESAEIIIVQLWAQLTAHDLVASRKPRTYRQSARADYLAHSKKRRASARDRRAARRQKLQYLRRDLGHVDRLLGRWYSERPGAGFPLAYRKQHRLWVIREAARQQDQLHRQRARRIDDRIVSLHQPHVWPIVRGRLGHPLEFDAKFSVALVDSITCVDRLRWDAFPEAGDLIAQCQAYRQRYGTYPAKVIADGVYGTRANRRWLKDRGIVFGGKPLGRPPKRTPEQQKAIATERRADARTRIPIEGKFDQGKGAYGLAKIAVRRADTSQAWIRAIFLVMNLIALERILIWLYYRAFASLWANGSQPADAYRTRHLLHHIIDME